MVPFVLPTVVVGMAFSGLRESLVAILVAHAFSNVAVVVLVVGAAWATIHPALEDAAESSGRPDGVASLGSCCRSRGPRS